MPSAWRFSAGMLACVMIAGCSASDSTPPKLSAHANICSAFKNAVAAGMPPFSSKLTLVTGRYAEAESILRRSTAVTIRRVIRPPTTRPCQHDSGEPDPGEPDPEPPGRAPAAACRAGARSDSRGGNVSRAAMPGGHPAGADP